MPVVAALILCATVTVHDGDTLRCNGEKVRIANIDAPELPGSSRCDPRQLRTGANPSWCDYEAGYASRDALSAFVQTGPVQLERLGTDRYGRTLGRVTVNGHDAGAYLVSKGLARWWK
ncbi:MAG: thermonuclease family protein [Novosphingobium sp.]|uniref:thermonuclease family protein n=1 Tax=Novosphingobium sp. TaxID=1874826 RepID=UPI003C7CB87D